MNCKKQGCTRYSDVDVYYADGSSTEMCAEHGWDEEAVQFVPQHGGDQVNIERPQ